MNVRLALRRAFGELYRYSWRLLIVNSALTAALGAVVLIVSSPSLALVLAPLVAGPFVAALVHCVLKLEAEDDFELSDAVEGLRLHWRRGLALGGLFGGGLLLGAVGVSFYVSERHRMIPLAVLCAYVLAVFCLFVLVSWPLAIAQPAKPLPAVLRDSWLFLLRNPIRLLALGAALLLVNALGAVTVLPLLTLTIAYSFLAAAHVVLPPPPTLKETT